MNNNTIDSHIDKELPSNEQSNQDCASSNEQNPQGKTNNKSNKNRHFQRYKNKNNYSNKKNNNKNFRKNNNSYNNNQNSNNDNNSQNDDLQMNSQDNQACQNQKNDDLKIEGIVEISKNKYAHILDPKRNGRAFRTDAFLPKELVSKFNIKTGSFVCGYANQNKGHDNPKIKFVDTIDGLKVDQRRRCPKFSTLTSILPEEQLKLETKDGRLTNRVIDLFCPIGKGTRGLIVAPPRTGKTTMLKDIAYGVLENHPECHLMVLLVDERPEEVTDFRYDVSRAEIYASSNDEEISSHLRIADMAITRAKNLLETGKDVVLLVDSLTRLSRAYNSSKSGSGRTMSGGLDIRALEKPRQLFASARNTQEAGSLTIIASILIETGSKMDELIFQEFKGTGNMEMQLNRKVAELRIWPAIDLNGSGTRREELLLSSRALECSSFLRRAMSNVKAEVAADTMVERIKQTKNNDEFLNLLDL